MLDWPTLDVREYTRMSEGWRGEGGRGVLAWPTLHVRESTRISEGGRSGGVVCWIGPPCL